MGEISPDAIDLAEDTATETRKRLATAAASKSSWQIRALPKRDPKRDVRRGGSWLSDMADSEEADGAA